MIFLAKHDSYLPNSIRNRLRKCAVFISSHQTTPVIRTEGSCLRSYCRGSVYKVHGIYFMNRIGWGANGLPRLVRLDHGLNILQ